jgi:ParB-like chromosome segregation protein Spo0J
MASLLDDAKLFAVMPDLVEAGERIGFYHEDKAAALGRLMAVDGQRDPIKVRANPEKDGPPWVLVTGMHRLMGARAEGIAVYAIEVSGTPDELADLEASENLHRRPLGPIERAKFTAALVTAAQERIAREHGNLSQHQMAIKARWDRVKHLEEQAEGALRDETEDTCAKIAHVYGWEESVGDALGMSRRTIHNDLAIFRLIIEPFADLAERLSHHPVVGENASQLKQITQVKAEGDRRRVIEMLLANSEIKVEDAMVALDIRTAMKPDATPEPHQKFYNQIEGGWDRLNAQQKRRFLPRIPKLLTTEMKRELRDLLNKELGDA